MSGEKKPILSISIDLDIFIIDISELLSTNDINFYLSKANEHQTGNLKDITDMFIIYKTTCDNEAKLTINHEKQAIKGNIRHIMLIVVLLSERLKGRVLFDYELYKFYLSIDDSYR